ncbi:HAD family phosphatase [Catenulispora subtropica]|uniref:HAD family phosphatase n=1 Tax=Catenulispora subtropica TaxID=450798 RepID=A0ABN2QPR3_9ACTN
MTQPVPPAAVLFDMDGLLIDSEPTWFQAEVDMLAGYGHTLGEEHYPHVLGKPLEVSTAYLLEITGHPVAAAEFENGIELAMIERLRDGVPMMPGAKELLVALESAGIPLALVSASSRRIVDACLPAIGADHFRFTVSGDDVARGKPNPDPYLKAAQLLGVDPAACVVLEDSPTGTAAGHAAGCRVVAVPHVAEVEPRERVTIVDSLRRVNLAFLRRLFDETGDIR